MKINSKDATLLSLLSVQAKSHQEGEMVEWIRTYCSAQGWSIVQDEIGNIYVRRPQDATDAPYALIVSHMDTVHDILPDGAPLVPVIIGDQITGMDGDSMRQAGIGGDDKCGIAAALYCLHHCKEPVRAAFFVAEEVGCIGSSEPAMEQIDSARFAMQADRRGNRDAVSRIAGRDISSPAFRGAISTILRSHGFVWCKEGGMTDVEALLDAGLGVACLNLSAGYYRPHCADELISMRDLANTCAAMVAIVDGTGEEVFPFRIECRSRYETWKPLFATQAAPDDAGEDGWCSLGRAGDEWRWRDIQSMSDDDWTRWVADGGEIL